jgi:peptide deformylase
LQALVTNLDASPYVGRLALCRVLQGSIRRAQQVAWCRADGATIERVAHDLLDTMRAHERCVGLAAPQLGELVRMVVVDVTEHPKAQSRNGLLVLVNPEVVRAEGSVVMREGCLSIPDFTANVRRATDVTIEARAPDGSQVRIDSDAFEARCLLHELDHLDGLLFLDRVAGAHAVYPRKIYL